MVAVQRALRTDEGSQEKAVVVDNGEQRGHADDAGNSQASLSKTDDRWRWSGSSLFLSNPAIA